MSGSDEDLIARAKGGDTGAFRALVDEHGRRVFGVAYRITGNRHDAEEVVQETFLKVFQTIDGFEGRSRFNTWLYRVASNAAMDLMRKRLRHDDRRADLETPFGTPRPLPSSGPDPERRSQGREIGDRIETAMAALTPAERTAFTLRHVQGMSIREIGDVLEISTGAVKNTIFRGVQKMRERLEPLAEEAT